MNKEILYIGFYDIEGNSSENRLQPIAAIDKMNYICGVLGRLGYRVTIVSPSRTRNKKYYGGKQININENLVLKLFPTLPWGNKLQKLLSIIFGDFLLFFYLLINAKKSDNVLCYHSLELRSVVTLARRIKGFRLILEVEEIYQDVKEYSVFTKRLEYITFKSVDKFIFPTELLNKKLNHFNKEYSLIYGTYQVESDRGCKRMDGKIHVVYAGTFDPQKGVSAAITSAIYLPEQYCLHIIGFGTEEQKNQVQELISEIKRKSRCTVSYDGLLRGEEYVKFLQNCDIGLSTQFPDASFNNTSFPSKILSYMANGLRVVSVRINAIEMSAIGNSVYFYDEQDPEEIANAIMSIDFDTPYDGKKIIEKLDTKFMRSLNELLEK